jgi:hypothetical protein
VSRDARIRRPGGPRDGEPATTEEVFRELHGTEVGEPVWLRASNGRVFNVHRGSAEYVHLVDVHSAVEIEPPEGPA